MTDSPYRPLRPDYEGPTRILRRHVPSQLWGDPVSGEVSDAIYVSNNKVHLLLFEMPPGGAFRHSPHFRTIFDTDEVYYVLSGALALCNPETGEVHRVLPGESVAFGPDTWHYGFSVGEDSLRVIEAIAPPPLTGSTQAYARTKPDLEQVRYGRDDLLGAWPKELERARSEATLTVIRDPDVLWRLEGQQPMLVGILKSTPRITVGILQLLPGQRSDPHTHGGDECSYVLEGRMGVWLPDAGGENWFELEPGDGAFLPEGTVHQYYNLSGAPARMLFTVAPKYLP